MLQFRDLQVDFAIFDAAFSSGSPASSALLVFKFPLQEYVSIPYVSDPSEGRIGMSILGNLAQSSLYAALDDFLLFRLALGCCMLF
jgi:lysozyme family protein